MNTKELTKKSVIARNTEIVTADMDGETVMMSIENGKYYNLGKMGTVIWNLIETPLSVETIQQKLLAAYNVKQDQCEAEVHSFLNSLQQENIITVR